MNGLMDPIETGWGSVPNRVWMAPLTRSRSTMPGAIPNEMMARYYAQRAGAGLIISEATPVCEEGHGYYGAPGIHTPQQVDGWREITRAVHDNGGRIVLQLWHVGRVSNSKLQPGGAPPVSSTHVASESKTYIDETFERIPNSEPRALEDDEIPGVVEQFARGAGFAKDAGFDGVEIHGANSYLLDQFTRDGVNTRAGAYGGSIENRIRFPLEVARAVVDVWEDPTKVGYRISPLSEHKDVRDSDPGATFSALARGLGSLGLGYLHAVETWDRSDKDPRLGTVIPEIVRSFKGAGGGLYIANGDLTPESADERIGSGWCDAVAFGKLFISNPDLPARIGSGADLAPWDTSTFYGGDERGYTDYPAMDSTTRV